MKKLLSTLMALSFLAVFAGSVFAGDVWVKSYYKNNGTYVQPHYRSTPDSNVWNNYSTKGNSNPYTGKKGYVNPYNSNSSNYGYKKKSYRKSYGW